MPLPAVIERFSADLAGELGLAIALQFDEALDAIDIEGDGNVHAVEFMRAVEWIAAHRDRTVMERIEAIDRLRRLEGFNVIDLKKFTGW